ncbi:MAG: iron-sulfur cluster assembly protein [Gemmatimonadales bacterium]|jgi:metal-sulfur cluster biosynthetic enzyme
MQTADTIRKALRGVRDPELNLNIIDLGLVYEITISDEGNVLVQMTLTSPGCPAGPEITKDVHDTANDLEGVNSVEVEIVWEPYWTPERIDPRVRAFLGM